MNVFYHAVRRALLVYERRFPGAQMTSHNYR